MIRKALSSLLKALCLLLCVLGCGLADYAVASDYSCRIVSCDRVDKNTWKGSFEVINNTNDRTIGRLDEIRIRYRHYAEFYPDSYVDKVLKLKNIRCSIPPLGSKKYKFTIKHDKSKNMVCNLGIRMKVRWEAYSNSDSASYSGSSSSHNGNIARPDSATKSDKVSVILENKLDRKISVALQWREADDGRNRCRGWYSVEPGKTRTITLSTTYNATRNELGFYATSGKLIWSSDRTKLRGPIRRPDKFFLWSTVSDSSVQRVNYRPVNLQPYRNARGGQAKITFQY